MKEDMYTYHYFNNRTIKRSPRIGNLIFQLVLLLSTVYIIAVTFLGK